MINVNLGKVHFKGNMLLIMEETEELLSVIRKFLVEKLGEKCGKEAFDHIIEASKMSEEELKKETDEIINGADKELLEMFMKMMKGMLGDE